MKKVLSMVLASLMVSALFVACGGDNGGGNKPSAGASGNRIVIGETQSFDEEAFGNLEVTLKYVEFINSIKNPMTGDNRFPDEGSIFLRAEFTLKNIGTVSGTLMTAWTKVIYDGAYEFGMYMTDGDAFSAINPLAPPTTCSITFMVPNSVAKSDGSLAIVFNNGMGSDVMTFVIRPGAGASVGQGAGSEAFNRG